MMTDGSMTRDTDIQSGLPIIRSNPPVMTCRARRELRNQSR
jgi:hypothetical protein